MTFCALSSAKGMDISEKKYVLFEFSSNNCHYVNYHYYFRLQSSFHNLNGIHLSFKNLLQYLGIQLLQELAYIGFCFDLAQEFLA